MPSSKKPFEIAHALKAPLRILRRDARLFIQIGILYAVIVFIPTAIFEYAKAANRQLTPIEIVVVALMIVIEILVSMGIIKIAFAAYDVKPRKVKDLVAPFNLFFNYIATSILYGIITAIGVLLLVIPGIFMAVRLQLCWTAVIDKRLGPIEALKYSYRMTEGIFWQLFGIQLIFVLLSVVFSYFLIAFGAVFVSLWQALAIVYIYRHIQKARGLK